MRAQHQDLMEQTVIERNALYVQQDNTLALLNPCVSLAPTRQQRRNDCTCVFLYFLRGPVFIIAWAL